MYYDELCKMPVVPTCDEAWLGRAIYFFSFLYFIFIIINFFRLTGEMVIVLVKGKHVTKACD